MAIIILKYGLGLGADKTSALFVLSFVARQMHEKVFFSKTQNEIESTHTHNTSTYRLFKYLLIYIGTHTSTCIYLLMWRFFV